MIQKFKEMAMPGKIGPSFAYTPQYAIDSDPKNILAAENAEELLANFWMDVYVYGEYPSVVLRYLKEQGITIDIRPGEMALLRSAKPDF